MVGCAIVACNAGRPVQPASRSFSHSSTMAGSPINFAFFHRPGVPRRAARRCCPARPAGGSLSPSRPAWREAKSCASKARGCPGRAAVAGIYWCGLFTNPSSASPGGHGVDCVHGVPVVAGRISLPCTMYASGWWNSSHCPPSAVFLWRMGDEWRCVQRRNGQPALKRCGRTPGGTGHWPVLSGDSPGSRAHHARSEW